MIKRFIVAIMNFRVKSENPQPTAPSRHCADMLPRHSFTALSLIYQLEQFPPKPPSARHCLRQASTIPGRPPPENDAFQRGFPLSLALDEHSGTS